MIETLSLHPGLIALKYKKMSGGQTAIIQPMVPVASQDAITIISDPVKPDGTLSEVGDCVVLRCTRPAKMNISITSKQSNVPARGSVIVEYLTSRRSKSQAQASVATHAPPVNLRCMGHISYWGDKWAKAGEWLAGPDRPMPIEGLMLEIEGSSQPGISMRNLASNQTARAGEFLGTRGHLQPLNNLDLWIEDSTYPLEMHTAAYFRDAGLVENTGKHVSVRGGGPTDCLLGFRISLVPSNSAYTGKSVTSDAATTSLAHKDGKPERVKIFRR